MRRLLTSVADLLPGPRVEPFQCGTSDAHTTTRFTRAQQRAWTADRSKVPCEARRCDGTVRPVWSLRQLRTSAATEPEVGPC